MLLRKKHAAPHSCFCVPHPQKNVSTGYILYRSLSEAFNEEYIPH